MNKVAVANSGAAVGHPSGNGLVMPIVVPVGRGSHAYTRANGKITSDTWTIDGKVFVRTFTWTNGALTGVSDWVPQ